MAKRAQTYPQVDPAADGVVNAAVIRMARGTRVADALAMARRRDAGVVAIADGQWVLREDLSRAASLGLNELVLDELVRPLPLVAAAESEVNIRRLLAAGTPGVVVRAGREVVGAVLPTPGRASTRSPLGRRFRDQLPEAVRAGLDTIAGLAADAGARAFLAGGIVRDALMGSVPAGDLDIIVEGDGPALARAFAATRGARSAATVEHSRFLTASVTVPDLGRVDFATARSERYEQPGALPRVMPSTISQDLGRRDFTVNALAVELTAGDWDLLDPSGGRRDLAARRLRVLHPLSFVEDPTRIFRAARYAVRLRLALDAWTARAVARALRLAPYPALSGQRLAAELERIAGEARPAETLRWLGRAGAFRLLDARYRFSRRTVAYVDALPATLGWSRQRGLAIAPLDLTLLALVADQTGDVAGTVLARLAFRGEPAARLLRAATAVHEGGARLTPSARASERARALWDRSELELAGLWLAGGSAARATLDWFLTHARGARPALNGDAVVALGVPRNAEVARVLSELRDARLDGVVSDRASEVAYVEDWMKRSIRTTKGGTAWLPSSSS
jgi:tRNA nucleotidyltransferase (CCA-adding enzyme)